MVVKLIDMMDIHVILLMEEVLVLLGVLAQIGKCLSVRVIQLTDHLHVLVAHFYHQALLLLITFVRYRADASNSHHFVLISRWHDL